MSRIKVRVAAPDEERFGGPRGDACWFPAGVLSAVLRCPSCGRTSSLVEQHRITPTGLVKPDPVCAFCDWSESVRLDGFKEHYER